MRYGLALPIMGERCDARSLAELAHVAEESGWDGVFLEDYVVHEDEQGRPDPVYDPWVALAAIAMRTTRLRLGVMVTPLSRRRPWKLARELVTLDHLSNGRMILGVGTGDPKGKDFTAFDEVTDARERGVMLDEALEVLVGLWSGKPFSYDGAHYHVRDVTFLPPPVQAPRIPIWVGGGYPKRAPLRRAARWDGACLYRHSDDWSWHDLTPDEVRAIRAAAETARGPGVAFDIAVGGRHRRPDLDAERALIRSLAEAGATWWTEYVTPSIGGTEAMREHIAGGPMRID